ncbi:hypothetical protein AAF712_012194 [Marasmius tenuissimus]|uniref:Uncharacterized protein n=1 Tax=Marasmius tenuissimus TaxID=585030 RepID=A0ABR2ZIG2_9AGAR
MQAETTTLEDLRNKMLHILEQICSRQAIVTPQLPDHFSEGASNDVEGSTLGLPSEMTPDECLAYGTSDLAAQESTLQRSCAYDIVSALQGTCRKLEVLTLYKDQHANTDSMRTRMRHTIDNVVDTRTEELTLYNYNCSMLVKLDAIQKGDSELPSLSGKDTAQKDISTKRRITKLPEFRLGLDEKEDLEDLEELPSTTQMTQREVRWSRSVWDDLVEITKRDKKQNHDPAQPAPPQTSGKKCDAKHDQRFYKADNKGLLWTMGSKKGTRKHTPAEMKDFEEEGDRISWTQQQVEVYCWMEEFKRKHAEFHRIIRYFRRMESAWRVVADDPREPVKTTRKSNFKWAEKLGIKRADVAYGMTKAGTERSKPADTKGKGKQR